MVGLHTTSPDMPRGIVCVSAWDMSNFPHTVEIQSGIFLPAGTILGPNTLVIKYDIGMYINTVYGAEVT